MMNAPDTGICPDDKKHIDLTIPVRHELKNSQVPVRLIIDNHDIDCIKVYLDGEHNDFKRDKTGNFEPIHLSNSMSPEVLKAIKNQLNCMFK